MAHEFTFASFEFFSAQHSSLIEALYAEAKGARWGLSRECFTKSLYRSAKKRFREGPTDISNVEGYLKLLHLEDLALACACGEGIEAAWEFFVEHFREDLRVASRAIPRLSGSGNDSRAEELADSLYAELYGIRSTGTGPRKSLFDYFHGRSKLSTWLRAILAQRHVDLLRTARGTVSLDGGADGNVDGRARELPFRAEVAPADPDRGKYLALLDRALLHALDGLAARERILLALYYVDQLTLAEIGRTLGEHESTVSRQLERTRRALRENVTTVLKRGTPTRDGHRGDPGLDETQVELAFEYALEDWPFDLSHALSKTKTPADPAEK